MSISTITHKGQVTIPKKIRDTLNLKKNDRVIFVRRGDSIILKPVRDIQSLKGSIKVKGKQDFRKIREEVKSEVAEDVSERIPGITVAAFS